MNYIFKKISLYTYLKILIFTVFFIIFFPNTLILNEDLNLFLSYEVDPGSNLTSIKNLFNKPYYNMNNSYTSNQYGWTWMAINFILLFPIKLFFYIFNIDNEIFINFSVKFIFHIINLLSIYILLRLSLKILKFDKIYLCLLIVCLYILNGMQTLFYLLKPETTGILFYFLSIIFLIDYYRKSKIKFFYLSFSCLFLSILSKQLFLFNSIFFSLLLFYLYLNKNNLFSNDFNSLKKGAIQLSKIIFLFLLIFFLVHPYAFFEPFELLKGQYILSTVFYNEDIGYLESLFKWIYLYKETHYLSIPFALNILSLLIHIYYKLKYKFSFLLNLVLFLSCILTILCVPISNQNNILDPYLVGLLPISFLQIILFLEIILYQSDLIKKIIFSIFVLYSLNSLIINYNFLYQNLEKRLDYKNSVQYKLYSFSKKNFTTNDKIAVDHRAGSIPEFMNSNICHYWRNCNTYKKINDFKPNYVIFSDPLPKWSWNDNIEGENLKKYVVENEMSLFKIIKSKTNLDYKLLIYKLK